MEGLEGRLKPGDIIRVDVDWIMASELSWSAMEKWYNQLGKPGIYRNDRFWLAGGHVVDPRIMEKPKIKPFRQFKMTENQGMNYTIMHTEFCRERAQPGMLVIGSDSHTCSGGSVSCLAIGLGVADVLLPLVTGETWFKVPETLEIRFELKRNTVAAERIVEFTGPGVQHLSRDARFAIANMCTEFGAVTGIFVPDAVTQQFVNKRKHPKYKSSAMYFRPDDDAEYAETHIIDLAQVESFVARYPKPDDVVPVSELAGLELQGCFIGACTTAEEDIVLAAFVLEEAMKRGARPTKSGKRKVVPGSRPILSNLRKHGLTEIFNRAGWEIGVPSCSYCVGMSADQAAQGETWLTSQNRNFENRMGPGSFGNLASAVTVAASSFDMKVTDPTPLLDAIDMNKVREMLGLKTSEQEALEEPLYVEPGAQEVSPQQSTSSKKATATPASPSSLISGRVYLLPDFVDTDALAPNEALSQPNITRQKLGTYCLYHTHPDFRQRVKEGQNIVVAGEGFGCGSSREDAVFALQAVGVQCVIAKSFAFIYGRNQPNLGLLGFELKDSRFWAVVDNNKSMKIDLDHTVLRLEVEPGIWEPFPFQLSQMQRRLMDCGGAEKAFSRYGKNLWQALTAHSSDGTAEVSGLPKVDVQPSKTEW
ncbi:hypothetical protein EDD36DRAFT_454669 [Exophiala viscosa]|uniref:Aconitase/3-isopropylmalate dehydratase large subunit alpha/beta/alpha domain-containing protein n=1 Tax=Exophiala viscosa TaxID=2486360 RepID=A0AAN6IH87_9EURO|nr:hypothetical protein EDD36DRAFT_454669 [Exophiala viscosa]